MKPWRFFITPENIHGSVARLSLEESHHLRDVLRLRTGDRVELFDGRGTLYLASICDIGTRVELEIVSQSSSFNESPLRLVLAPSLLQGEKLDWIVQKCTELGMTDLLPFESKHSEVSVARILAQKRPERWRKIALAAAKQSRRTTVPRIRQPIKLHELCAMIHKGIAPAPGDELLFNAETSSGDLLLAISEKAGLPACTLSGVIAPARVLVLLGPEGGWAENEIALLQKAGFQLVGLGPRILRSETAAVAVTTLIQYLWGDLAGTHEL
jgi:16S rRNA (uracil1498-N3)-methyltransferase